MTSEQPAPDEATPGTLARRLEHLFQTVYPKGRGRYTNPEAAALINERAGEKLVSQSYLWQLRHGARDDPSLRRITAIARLFGVPVDYFSDDELAARVDAQLELLVALRDAGVRDIALRASGLSDNALQSLALMADGARRLEGLPTIPADAAGDPESGAGAAGETD
ncbi:helix-turn-helix domain-containing protein [Yinghuangia soli]|uniref:Helix-turn-helix domain-containing protein n=1 Tax=Yinghuangia soli TaxID=2908204 RepID=A0AA41Q6I1_9ACTN|nr:helix-turn-helix domain-containing protein [Yinghuangia soli]MCF2532418.1 helix-turn-helix domain-containing protein [Yinghuangia soli]